MEFSRSASISLDNNATGLSQRFRSRSNSGVRLDFYQRLVYKTILKYQDPVSGLFPGSADVHDAWIRDNVYSVLSVWALSLAYRKNSDLDEDRAKCYELQQRCIKNMRSLLICMVKQAAKVEKFKKTQSPLDSLHAKYGCRTLQTVVGDGEYGHLQVDAVSLYLLILAQMTASGVQVIYTLDEVAFVQNLVFYVEAAYRIPDYGVWERGDKTNHGLPELNSSSVGMAKAALEALNDLDLFGARGGPASVIHCIPDETQKCHAVLQSMLPRESNSKEVDAALLCVIGYPAFAVEDPDLIHLTRHTLIDKLQGRYGLRRFLRDGYRTCREDSNRLHYQPWELKAFENIECEWPMFFCYLLLDAYFNNDTEAAQQYWQMLEDIIVVTDDGLKVLPEMYTVPIDKIEAELKSPHSQDRCPIGRIPFLWGQSLYILCCLIREGFVACGEIDPLCRRYITEKKPDVVVQVVLLADTEAVQEKLRKVGIEVQTVNEVSPIEVYPARVLSYIYGQLGKSRKLALSGRPSSEVGVLSTSTLYQLHDRVIAFMPQFLDPEHFYLSTDVSLLVDMFRTDIAFLKSNWRMLGRPTIILEFSERSFDSDGKFHPALAATYRKGKTGYLHGARVVLGSLSDFLNTSCICTLQFLDSSIDTGKISRKSIDKNIRGYIDQLMSKQRISKPSLPTQTHKEMSKRRLSRDMRSRTGSIAGLIRRGRSIQVDTADPGMINIRSRLPSQEFQTEDGQLPENFHTSSVDKMMFQDMSEKEKTELDPQELLDMLQMTESLGEQAEIIYFLYLTQGLNWDTRMTSRSGKVTVGDLIRELYEKACQSKKWWLVRHSAGMLDKRVEDLARAVSDLIVHQKQVTVGMPSDNEITITRPLPPDELQHLIRNAYKADSSTAMLTQELLMYLAMFVRTEPELFHDLLRLRVGLIIQIMATELARALKCKGEEASDYLLNLSPYEMKTLLHHILSGKEIGTREEGEADILKVVPVTTKAGRSGIARLRKSIQLNAYENVTDIFGGRGLSVPASKAGAGDTAAPGGLGYAESMASDLPEKTGRWLRRRRLDGALNRLPQDFYPRIWSLLEKSQGIYICDVFLNPSLTNEMTAGEMKFAIHVENILSTVAQPEYRQLLLEALMVLTMLVEYEPKCSFSKPFYVKSLVDAAYRVFLKDQIAGEGDATMCCAKAELLQSETGPSCPLSRCGGAAGICLHFYDSAPSGRYGTMTCMCRAAAVELPMHFPTATAEGLLECNIS
ncbi:probable phosphorylase b kinase regulatory subunit alpha [Paramacrobiotus metropolitanus]|uniref:probable phosphorylase b kinase regulatory subunit alpha n=1 Tax=Paramacrobiotus metropolitanus TaxID=2943436 RepID=UPI0024463800|nr:probable phosphorylase b kinase regulatory subunit alpha [Paramacrobiotus metropolitanus]